jgi:hypothetical protein
VILNGFFQHAAATGILFDGYLIAQTGEMSHSSIEGLRPTAPEARGNHPGGRFPERRTYTGLGFGRLPSRGHELLAAQ